MREKVQWGVDSAAKVTSTLYDCVITNYGYPFFWGRYLKTIPDVSAGLTKEEITFLRNKGIKILPIYNDFESAVGYSRGKIDAGNAIYSARSLGIPKDTYIFANVEDFFKVDEGWLRGWVDVFFSSGFRPGFYANPVKGDFQEAYCSAVANNVKVAQQAIIWSSAPQTKATSAKNKPAFAPATLGCQANVWLWQYGKSAQKCPVDTNIALAKLLTHLW